MVKSNKSLIIILSCFAAVVVIFFARQQISNMDVFIGSRDGKWKIGYVKDEKSLIQRTNTIVY